MMKLLTALVLLALPLIVPADSFALPGVLLVLCAMSLAAVLQRLGILRRLAVSLWLMPLAALGISSAILEMDHPDTAAIQDGRALAIVETAPMNRVANLPAPRRDGARTVSLASALPAR
ncbi:MAG: hypothetical protein D6754_02335 [Alphaproteobacteria bacterium]|nr:MAG: hypothetical protein D6754_02335 [Alphaproteobacteria bacterium]